MKKMSLLVYVILFGLLSTNVGYAFAEENQQVTHVVMVWLKQPGNEQQRTAFIKASEQLNSLPGIVNRHVGVVVPSDRSIVDDTFDVAVTVTMESPMALKNYLNHPKHKKILQEKIKPLTNRVVVYDFMSQ
ncbi:MAG: Dabb family protein [Methylococcaceae bacterium]|nr:Dabb family protein [Methylococcaceae bacterium]